jgi:hypothetical protein
MAEGYMFHFCTPVCSWTSELTCGELAYKLGRKAPTELKSTCTIEQFTPTETNLAEEWKEIAKLQWTYLSDGEINAEVLRKKLCSLDARRLQLAMQRVEEHVCRSLEFGETSRNSLLQFMALGRDNLKLAGNDKEFRRYLENEVQKVDLASLLTSLLASLP